MWWSLMRWDAGRRVPAPCIELIRGPLVVQASELGHGPDVGFASVGGEKLRICMSSSMRLPERSHGGLLREGRENAAREGFLHHDAAGGVGASGQKDVSDRVPVNREEGRARNSGTRRSKSRARCRRKEATAERFSSTSFIGELREWQAESATESTSRPKTGLVVAAGCWIGSGKYVEEGWSAPKRSWPAPLRARQWSVSWPCVPEVEGQFGRLSFFKHNRS